MARNSNRKTTKCLNCGEKLKPAFEYCPQCGQENSDLQLTFLQMLRDFFSNYFALDSRFGRSFKPFFLKPGFLTEEFMKGKRMSYANPIRLYLVISVIHFFIFSIYFEEDGLSTTNNRKPTTVLNDSTRIDDSKSERITLEEDTLKLNLQFGDDYTNVAGNELTYRINLIQKMADNHEAAEIYDSLHLENKSYLTQLTWKQVIKLTKNGESSLGRYFLKNIPILMFFLLPVYAVILKIFFSRNLYINHIVHSIHIHSFAFLTLTVFWLYCMIFDFAFWPFIITILLLYAYINQSFRRTYQIRIKKSIFRVLWTGIFYSMVLQLSLLFTLLISFFMF